MMLHVHKYYMVGGGVPGIAKMMMKWLEGQCCEVFFC